MMGSEAGRGLLVRRLGALRNRLSSLREAAAVRVPRVPLQQATLKSYINKNNFVFLYTALCILFWSFEYRSLPISDRWLISTCNLLLNTSFKTNIVFTRLCPPGATYWRSYYWWTWSAACRRTLVAPDYKDAVPSDEDNALPVHAWYVRILHKRTSIKQNNSHLILYFKTD